MIFQLENKLSNNKNTQKIKVNIGDSIITDEVKHAINNLTK